MVTNIPSFHPPPASLSFDRILFISCFIVVLSLSICRCGQDLSGLSQGVIHASEKVNCCNPVYIRVGCRAFAADVRRTSDGPLKPKSLAASQFSTWLGRAAASNNYRKRQLAVQRQI